MDFFTSDTHFGHVNVIRYCNRPFKSVEEMDAALIAKWNRRVGPEDTVYHLGDFALGLKTLWPEYRRRLNGRIMFILGNHDSPLYKFLALLQPTDMYDETDYLYSNGRTISLAHVPLEGSESRTGRPHPPRANSYPDVHVDLWFCGHVHQLWRVDRVTGCINVGVDVWDYEPRTLDEILDGTNQSH